MKQIYLILLILLFPFKIFSQTKRKKTLLLLSETTQTTMIKTSLDVPLVSPIPQTGYIHPFGMYGITPFDYGYMPHGNCKRLQCFHWFESDIQPQQISPSG